MAALEYRLRLRTAANDADALVVTSTRGGANPYVSGIPSGDGASLERENGKVMAGVFSGRIVDPITSGTSRLFTSQLEDANSRQQLGHRRAFWEFREDAGSWQTLAAGRLVRYTLASDIEWDIAIADWTQAEHETDVFGMKSSDTFATYLARWPNRGCVIGGPVLNGFGENSQIQNDLGGWRMKYTANSPAAGYSSFTVVSAYGPDSRFKIVPTAGGTPDNTAGIFGRPNDAVQPLYSLEPYSTIALYGLFPGLFAIINRDVATALAVPLAGSAHNLLRNADPGITRLDGFVIFGTVSGLSTGDVATVDVITLDVSALSPIYWSGHPMDLIAELLDEASIPYDTTSLEAMRDTLGATLRIAVRVTKAHKLGKYLEQTIYGPFGIGCRTNPTTGAIEFFSTRVFTNNVATLTEVDETDVEAGSTMAFSLDTAAAIRTVVVEHERYVGNAPDRLDGVATIPERIERINADPGAIGTGEITYELGAMVHWAQYAIGALETNEYRARWVSAIAHQIFDRWGRGGIGLRTVLLRGQAGDDAELGDEMLFNLPAVPNQNKRLGDDSTIAARAMQVMRRTWRPTGIEVECEDSGPNAQPVGTVPTLSVAKSSTNGRNTAELTITNAAALNALPAGILIQVAFLTSGATPAAEDYSDMAAYATGTIPTTAIRLPSVFQDSKVSVRARSTQPTKRPSNWSSVATVTLDALNPPTGVAAAAVSGDGSLLDVTWAIGSGSDHCETEVYVRLQSESASANRLAHITRAGSLSHRIRDLAPSTQYTVSVRHRDPGNLDRSALATANQTTNGTTRTLAAPTNPDGFSFPVGGPARAHRVALDEPFRQSRYGLAVVAQEFPGSIEIAEAVETAVGSGSYGAYATVETIESVSGDWSVWSRTAPTDGLRRKVKARHIATGATASAYTSEVVVNPATLDPLAIYPTAALLVRATVQSTSATQVVVRVAVADPSPDASTADVSLAYAGTGVGTISPASPRTMAAAGITNDIATTDTEDITIDRAAFGTGTGRVTFTATRTGRVAGTDSVDVPALDSSGPSLTVTPTPGGTSYSIVWSGTGTITVSIDGAAYATPSASPITVTRTTADQTYAFKAVLDGQTITNTVVIPKVIPTITISAPTFDSGADTLEVSWSSTGLSSPVFDVRIQQNGAGGVDQTVYGVTSPYTFTSVTGSTASGVITVWGKESDVVKASGIRSSSWPS